MADWDLQRLGQACALTGRPFAAGDTVWSALFQVDGRLLRADFSAEAWARREAAVKDEQAPPMASVTVHEKGRDEPQNVTLEGEPLYFWQQVKTAADEDQDKKGKPKQRYVDDDILLDIFKQLEDAPDGQRQAFRYMLALHLIRRKRLKLTDVVREGEQERLIITASGEDAAYKVLDPKLSEEEMLAMREQMSSVLEMDKAKIEDEAAAAPARAGSESRPESGSGSGSGSEGAVQE